MPLPTPELEPPYRPVERCLLAAMTLLWRRPQGRSLGRAVAVGALLGAWQWVKFGGAVYASSALVVVDVAALTLARADRRDVRRWMANTAVAAGMATLLEVFRVAWAWATLPPAVATDFIWPAYTASHYTVFTERYPGWYGWRHFVLHYAVPVSGLLGTVVAIVHVPRMQAALSLFVAPAFFLLGIGTFLGHAHIYRVYAWCLLPPLALLVAKWPRATTAVLITLWLPGAVVHVRDMLIPPAPVVVERLPRQHPVAWEPEYREAYQAVVNEWARWSESPDARPLVMPVGSGFYFISKANPPSRHCWLLPHYFRPYDEVAFLEGLDRIPFIAYVSPMIPKEADLGALIEPTFGPAVASTVRMAVVEEVRVNSVCRIFRLRHSPKQ